ncbi:ATP-binding cassette domain-containing protein [Natronoglycomyces albus]|uniref:ATP-binding cassette domain-containing protein n=1 Tax=Natronoglycomyces albus TaxID=2811108 RepID=A0A895XVS3_9ACTN|nr:ATP-binding cassette domain-containing protein [Natronoglycomyces albus]QSB06320.1 ATP-binding cassette domain-containing protein [Natronoglycomyces albus]
MTFAIQVEGLVKTYGDVRALDGLDLAARPGTVLGVLGPNGAGKTTSVRILATLAQADAGRATVCGLDVAREPRRVREVISVTGQFAGLDDQLSGKENLVFIARLLGASRKQARDRADELLERFELTDAASRAAETFSGGMRRRLDLAASLMRTPQVLFLDEPTNGLDPASRNQLWEVVGELVDAGTTVLLTTQYLEEADRLADDLVIIDGGRSIATGSPSELKRSMGAADLDEVFLSLTGRSVTVDTGKSEDDNELETVG